MLPTFKDFVFTPIGGPQRAIRVDIEELPLTGPLRLPRASFGTIRAIALFAMLHDPHPPKLTCLEEVDHGLHPHALDRLVERLREASKRTQIVVATHSPAFVNRLSAQELVVFERDRQGDRRNVRPAITADQIKKMEKELGFALGELWFSGLIGGGLNADEKSSQ